MKIPLHGVFLGLILNGSALCADASRFAPEWARSAIWYQIFPERFRNGDPANDPTRGSLEWPITPSDKWHATKWTGDWYARDDWETEQDKPGDPDPAPNFYKHGVFDRRYGGDLQGVLDRLDYLVDLGVNALYFNPLFYSRSLHKYDGNTYHHIDPYFGPDPKGDLALMEKETADPKTWKWTAADKLFLNVVKQAHQRGLRVILDGVFNHTGRDFFAFKDLRRNQEKSPYKNWYVVDAFDDPQTKRNEFDYKGWWGHKTLPVFAATADGNDMAPAPKGYIFEATRRWMRPDGDMKAGIDGWRLDVADERPAKFWADWNDLVRQLNPQAYTTAEIWHDASKLIADGHFSACMNYNAFAIPLTGFLIDNHTAPTKFAQMIEERRNVFPSAVQYVMQNLTDSHDTDRLGSMVVNGESAVFKSEDEIPFNDGNDARVPNYKIQKPDARQRSIQRLVTLFQMTYVGAPMVYYGTEAGMWGGHDPDCRMPMVWADLKFDPQAIDPRGNPREPDEVNFDAGLFEFYKNAIHLRREHRSLNTGEYKMLAADDTARTFAFARQGEGEELVVALNRSEQPQTVSVSSALASPGVVFASSEGTIEVKTNGGTLQITLPPLTGAVIGAAKH